MSAQKPPERACGERSKESLARLHRFREALKVTEITEWRECSLNALSPLTHKVENMLGNASRALLSSRLSRPARVVVRSTAVRSTIVAPSIGFLAPASPANWYLSVLSSKFF